MAAQVGPLYGRITAQVCGEALPHHPGPPATRPIRRRPGPRGCPLADRRVDEAGAHRRLILLFDIKVLVDVLQNDPQWADWSIAQMRALAKLHALVINSIIYAEVSLSFSTLEALDSVVATLALELHEIPRPALLLAAKAYAQYRRRGGTQLQVLPNFFIGAHAAVEGWPLLTRDAARFRRYFSTLDIVAP